MGGYRLLWRGRGELLLSYVFFRISSFVYLLWFGLMILLLLLLGLGLGTEYAD